MRKAFLVLMALFFLVVVLCACGGSSGGGSCADPTVDLTDSWLITETNNTNDCGEGIQSPYTLVATQSGSDLSVYSPNLGQTFSGQVCGAAFTYTGSYPEDGGTTVLDPVSANISGDTMSGTSTWRWSDGSESCSGVTEFTATRQ